MGKVDYSEHYKLIERFEQEDYFIAPPVLYDIDIERQFDEALDRLAQPLPNGQTSPYSSRNPFSGQALLLGVLLYQLNLTGNEFNWIPDLVWFRLFQMLGLTLAPAEYPIIELEITRDATSTRSRDFFSIPIGTRLFSSQEQNLEAILKTPLNFYSGERVKTVEARLNFLGQLTRPIPRDEFQIFNVTSIESVRVSRIIYTGRDRETLPQAMLRGRQQLQRGRRCVTYRDYHRTCIELGATKVAVLPGIYVTQGEGQYADLMTIAVYPPNLASTLQPEIEARSMATVRVQVIAAEIIPLNGTIEVRAVPGLLNPREIAAKAIVENVNPPGGKWGDREFLRTLATALENQPSSFYAVPNINLKHSETNVPFSEMEPMPWQLFEIQDSVVFEFI